MGSPYFFKRISYMSLIEVYLSVWYDDAHAVLQGVCDV